MTTRSLLARRGLIVVTGKGGVGKSTLTAALGRLFAARGRKTLLLEAESRQSLHPLLGVPPAERGVTPVAPNLWLQALRPTDAIEALVRERLKIAALARRVVENPIFEHFTAGAPGFKELALLGHALRLIRGEIAPKPDVVLLDAPASGHAATLLTAPTLVAGVIPTGPVGQIAAQVAALVSDPDRCGIVIATHADEMPVQEALELIAALDTRIGRRPELVVVNALYPAVPPGRGARGASPALALWRGHHADNLRQLKRLREGWRGPLARIPLLAAEHDALVADVARHLEAQ